VAQADFRTDEEREGLLRQKLVNRVLRKPMKLAYGFKHGDGESVGPIEFPHFPAPLLETCCFPSSIRLSTVELTAILVGRGSHGSQERTPHRISTSESARGSDLFETSIRSL
jgi:hypothetical protein